MCTAVVLRYNAPSYSKVASMFRSPNASGSGAAGDYYGITYTGGGIESLARCFK
jgi:hypothetical protein